MRKLLRAWVIVTLISVALSMSATAIPAEAGTAIFSVSGPAQSVKPGEQFTVAILVQPNAEIAGTQFNLSFNPALATVNSVIEGNLLKQGGFHTYFSPGVTDNNNGMIMGVSATIIDPGHTVSTQGIFASITFTAGSSLGVCPLTLSKALAGDLNAQPVSVSTVNAIIVIDDGVNQPPVLNSIGNRIAIAGSPLSLSIIATDPDGDILTYSVSNLPPGANFDPLSRAFSWTPTTDQISLYPDVQFEVTDGTFNDSENITITVVSSSSSGGGGGGGGSGARAPTFTPLISRTPTITPITSSIIDNDGVFNQSANVKSTDGMAVVVVDQGTKGLSKDGKAFDNITITAIKSLAPEQEQSNIVGTVYSIGPNEATFDHPVKLVFTYNPSLIPQGADENNLVVAAWDNASSHWTELASTVNVKNRTVTAKVSYISTFAVLATDKKPVVANFVTSKLSLSNPEANIGETVTASALITNTSNASGTYNIILKINGNIEGEKDITLDKGVGQEVTFDVREDVPGIYNVDLNGLSLPLFVKEFMMATSTSPIPNASESVDNATPFKAEEPPSATILSTVPNVKTFGLSLLAEIIGGAFILIVAITSLILLRRRQLLKK